MKEWLIARGQTVTNRDFPSTSTEVKQLLEEFRSLREREDSVREKEKTELAEMCSELKVFALKRKKDIDILPIDDIEQVKSPVYIN